jgi:hypothetical protein
VLVVKECKFRPSLETILEAAGQGPALRVCLRAETIGGKLLGRESLMRRVLPALIGCLFFTIPALAQRGGGHGGGGMRGGGMRGGGSFGGVRGGGFNHSRSFGGQFGFRRFPRTAIYPFFYGGFGYSDPYFSNPYPNYASYPSAGYSNPAPVIISQNYYYGYAPAESSPAPRVEEYRPEPAAPSEPRKEEASLYLIAFKDHNIRAVLAYWADGATLHYVTMDHEQKQTTVSSVDRELSERLNRERNVRFGLPR